MEIREKIVKLISDEMGIDNANQLLNASDNLNQLGMNSLSYIKLAVLIEKEFGIEFEDEALEDDYFTTFSSICSYIENRVNKMSSPTSQC